MSARIKHRKINPYAFCRTGNGLLSQVLRHSTIGAIALNGRVRDGIGFYHDAKVTSPAKSRRGKLVIIFLALHLPGRTLVMEVMKPIELLVLVSSMHYCTYTPSLSTW